MTAPPSSRAPAAPTAPSQERGSADSALRAAEARYRTVLDSIDEGYCTVEILLDDSGTPSDYRFLEVNRAFERQTGLENPVGRRMRELAPAHEEHWYGIYGRVALTGEPIRFERRAAALGRWYDVYAFRVGEPEHRQVGVLFQDVTARKTAELALQESDRRKTGFLAVLSHELRNPLAPIRNGLALLERSPEGSPHARHAREVIRRQVEHLTRLVEDLLDVSRIAHDKITLERSRFDAREVVRRACEDVRPGFEERGLALRLDITSAPLFVDADPTRLAQITGNLLANALKFTPAAGTVDVTLRNAGGRLELRVRDSGAGIEPHLLEEIFEPFAQAERTRGTARGGMGLGLALVKRLAALHGGAVRAHSEGAGRGAELIVTLPLVPAAEVASAPARAPEAQRLAILVVEDNRDAGETLVELLELQGHRARLADDGRSGLAALASARPDVLVCDVGLPDLSGYELVAELRRTPGTPVYAIALTGYAQSEDVARARAAGFDAHLAKPPAMERLEALLAEAAARRA